MGEGASRRTMHDLIGDRFEDIFRRQFPDFKKMSDNGGDPDFFNGKIWVETKTGYMDFGVRLKPRQIKSFQRIKNKPVLYAIGYHNFENSYERLEGLGEEETRELLEKEMKIVRAYLVSRDVIKSVYREESRTAPRSLITYAMLKERFLKAIIEDKTFFRKGHAYNPRSYYRINRDRYHLRNAPAFIESNGKLRYGLVLRKNEKNIEKFLRERQLV